MGIGKTLAAVTEIGSKKFESVPKIVAFAGLYKSTIRRIDKLQRLLIKMRLSIGVHLTFVAERPCHSPIL